MLKSISVPTSSTCEFIDITSQVQNIVTESNIKNGVVTMYVAHTTAGITINENADPDVKRDILTHLDKLIPQAGNYRHGEGNSPAHIKASLMGSSASVIINNGKLMLGTWQDIYFCEFDGPRTRKVWVKIIEG
ncbi:MAG: secondary thiamine-phosphate synthase enzyme YjbQ [candidate division Zixibacteria bacterium]